MDQAIVKAVMRNLVKALHHKLTKVDPACTFGDELSDEKLESLELEDLLELRQAMTETLRLLVAGGR